MKQALKILWIFYSLLITACYGASGAKPEEFITRIYAQYQAKNIPDLLGTGGDTIFTPRFLGNYRDFSKGSHDRHGLGWDPLCWCDDKEFPGYNISEVKIKSLVVKTEYAEVDVYLKVGGFGEGGVLILRKISGKWMIDDIRTEETPSLITYMEANKNPKKTLSGNH